MHHVKRIVRRLVAYALYYTGLLWLYAALRLHRRAVVLMYHRVLPDGADTFSHSGIIVTPETFDRQMAFLARHFRTLTQTQFRQELAASKFGRRACLVTFDDGWWDNLKYALPVLERHGIPAIVFVATGFIGTVNTFWQERLTRLLCLAVTYDGIDPELARDAGLDGLTGRSSDRIQMQAREFVTSLKPQAPEVSQQLIQRLQAALRDKQEAMNLGADRFMTWDELRALHQSGLVTIGSHAHSHTRLTTLGYKGARLEFETSRRELARNGIASDVIACAYPNGDVNDSVEAAATDARFALGFRTKGGLVRHCSEATCIRRINIHDADSRSPAEFLYRILGLP
jgi:peptidoglycan/xylan/chitin deacetylase (PgdA/CDA1 family)